MTSLYTGRVMLVLIGAAIALGAALSCIAFWLIDTGIFPAVWQVPQASLNTLVTALCWGMMIVPPVAFHQISARIETLAVIRYRRRRYLGVFIVLAVMAELVLGAVPVALVHAPEALGEPGVIPASLVTGVALVAMLTIATTNLVLRAKAELRQ